MALTLYFRELELGEVIETSYDFPGISGTFERSLHWGDSDLWQQLERYIAYCQKQDVLLVADEIARFNALVEIEDDKYLNLMETEDWFLKSQQGEIEKILIPFFGLENHINWRPNFLNLD